MSASSCACDDKMSSALLWPYREAKYIPPAIVIPAISNAPGTAKITPSSKAGEEHGVDEEGPGFAGPADQDLLLQSHYRPDRPSTRVQPRSLIRVIEFFRAGC